MASIGGERKIRQREVAARAGVSISTVSRVLNNSAGISHALKQRVMAAARELDIEQRQRVQRSALQHICLFSDRFAAGRTIDPFHSEILSGVEDECRRLGIHLSFSTITQGAGGRQMIVDKVRHTGVDGLLFLSIDDQDLLAESLELECSVAVINAEHMALALDSYTPDNWFGPQQAVRHLIEHGHSRILHVTYLQRPTIRRRFDAYRATLKEADIPFAPELVLEVHMSSEPAYRGMKAFLAGTPPDFSAIFCANDLIALGVMRALQEEGRNVPQDVSIVGCDDIVMAAFTTPPLTTIRIRREELGMRAVRGLLERASYPALETVRVELATRLVVRQSVAIKRA